MVLMEMDNAFGLPAGQKVNAYGKNGIVSEDGTLIIVEVEEEVSKVELAAGRLRMHDSKSKKSVEKGAETEAKEKPKGKVKE